MRAAEIARLGSDKIGNLGRGSARTMEIAILPYPPRGSCLLYRIRTVPGPVRKFTAPRHRGLCNEINLNTPVSTARCSVEFRGAYCFSLFFGPSEVAAILPIRWSILNPVPPSLGDCKRGGSQDYYKRDHLLRHSRPYTRPFTCPSSFNSTLKLKRHAPRGGPRIGLKTNNDRTSGELGPTTTLATTYYADVLQLSTLCGIESRQSEGEPYL
ncbi:hypothetical protein B0H16DRAFT_1457513 [Mycena metata]|uniref:Uncharacterized protein n=1 Tax=Mycena metata TaxID=1033252 RepID=A0AAD7NF16_9AGAR|nr:hypothetical protein B0H16DRAFT_1457513 [Mycena metata]